jgi:PKD repeat protein
MRTLVRSSLVLVIAALLLGAPAAARAEVTNIIATNEAGEPLDDAVTTIDVNEPLWAYITTTTGAIICVHPDPVLAGSSCNDDGVWGVSAASPFFAGPVPVTAAPLKPGFWRLIATRKLGAYGDDGLENVSQPFAVTVCQGDCPKPSPPDPSFAKSVFTRVAESMKGVCELSKLLTDAKIAQNAKQAYDLFVTDGVGAGVGMAAVSILVDTEIQSTVGVFTKPPLLPGKFGAGLWGMCSAFFGIQFPELPIPFVDGPGVKVPGPLGALAKWIYDPPDASFELVAHPDPIDWSQIDTSIMEDPSRGLGVAREVDALRADLVAGTTSWERFQGAMEAGDSAAEFQHAQAGAVGRQFSAVHGALGRLALEVDDLSALLQAEPDLPLSITQEEIDRGTAYRQRVHDSGFTDAEIAQMHAAGLGDAAIADLRSQLGDDEGGTIAAGDSIIDKLTRLSDDLRAAQPAVDEFAREAAAFAGETNVPPVAHFSIDHPAADPLRIDVTDASDNADLDPLTITWDFGDGSTAPGTAGGTVSHTYTDSGTYDVTETVSDDSTTDTLTKSVRVGLGNGAPTAVDDALTTPEDTPGVLDVVANDSDPDHDHLTVTVTAPAGHGTASCDPGGTCTYTPFGDYSGSDSFTYRADDGLGGTATATVNVTVTEVNDVPYAAADGAEVPYGGTDTLVDVLANDSPGGGEVDQTLMLDAITAPPAHGTAAIEAGGIRYTPDPGFGGRDAFTYRACDDGTTAGAPDPQCGTADVSVWVRTRPPVAGADTLTTDEDTSGSVDVLANDSDPDGNPLSVDTSPRESPHGETTCTADGTCTYTPAKDYNGPDVVAYVLRDSSDETATGTITVTVDPVNDAPVAHADRLFTRPATPATVDVLADDTDVDGDSLQVAASTDGAHGHVSCTAGGVCTYTPDAGFSGRDTFGYTATDGHGGTDHADVSVIVMLATPPANVLDSKGRDFWLTFGTNLGTPVLSLFVTGDRSTTGTLAGTYPDLPSPFAVHAGDVTTIGVPTAAALDPDGGNAVRIVPDSALHLTAADEVSVYGLNLVTYTTDAYLGLPTDVLGTDYLALGWGNGTPRFDWNESELSVVAMADGTDVTLTPPGGSATTYHLDAGDVLVDHDRADGGDVTGTAIHATHRVAVVGGNQCANIPTTAGFCDHVVEEIPPVSTWGREFVTAPLAERAGGDRFRILASQDGTTVKVGDTVVANLDRGQFHELLLDHAASITASAPVLVAQYANGSEFDLCAESLCDPFMMLVPPYEQFLQSYTVTTPANGYRDNLINVVVPSRGAGTIRLDGETQPASAFHAIAGTGFAYAQLPVSVGTHIVESPDAPFGAFVYGWDSYDGYGYPAGLSLAPVAEAHQLVLAPRGATWTTGTRNCVTGTLTDAHGAPLKDVRVDYTVTGAHPRTASVTTDAAGKAALCVQESTAGADTVAARVGSVADQVTETWAAPVTPTPTPTPTPSPTPTPTPTPKATPPPTIDDIVDLPSTKRCVSRRKFTIRIRKPKGDAIRKAVVMVDGKPAKVRKGARFTAVIDLRGLRKGRFVVRITVTTAKHRTIRGTRNYKTCAHKRGKTHHIKV